VRPIKAFEEYIDEQIVKVHSKDSSRARSLQQEAKQTEKVLNQIIQSTGITDENANTIIKIAYDIIMEQIRAEMLLEGYHATGQGAHEAEVAYLRVLLFNEKDIQFCDQIRYFRNGIMYYGKTFQKEYAQKIIDFLKKFENKIQKKQTSD